MPTLGLGLSVTRPVFLFGDSIDPASVPWILSSDASTLRNDFTGWAGGVFTPAVPITLKALGRIFVTGNTQSHDVGIFDSATGDPIRIVAVDCSTGVNDQFNYSPIPATSLLASTSYVIASLETNGGDQFYESTGQITTADAMLVSAAFRAGISTTGSFTAVVPGSFFVPPNFRYVL